MFNNISAKAASEWMGCFTGLIGAFMLALHTSYSGWGWVFFLVSNLLWIIYGLLARARALVLMQLGFGCTSLLGVSQWLVK